jgi:predicted alpha/beta superfamily hydrolase
MYKHVASNSRKHQNFMKKTIFILLLLISSLLNAQKKIQTLEHKYIVDSISSKNIQDYRTIKIFLPKNYSEKEKYPTIYTLDGEWMFEPTVSESKILMDFDVIPKSIVVGVFHKNRNIDLSMKWNTGEFNKGSMNFFKFLTEELIPHIDTNYSTSNFNVLIGHSNSATFNHKVLVQNNQPFKGIVSLSQNLFGSQLEEYIEFTRQSLNSPVFYFIASGKRDATPRLESGMKLDSLFKLNINLNLKTKHILYDADHNGIAAKGLNNGISHVFSEYQHYNDWNDKLIDSLISNNVNSIDFIKQHSRKIKKIYGVNFKVNQNDLSLMKSIAENETDIEEVKSYEIKHFGISEHFYASYAQFYEYSKIYTKALEYWNIHLNNNYENITSFFYYRRPIDLLHKKMNQPKKAIEFAENWKQKIPKFSHYFNLRIASIALESNTKRKNGLRAISEYIKNYKKDFPISLEKAKQIEQKLK